MSHPLKPETSTAIDDLQIGSISFGPDWIPPITRVFGGRSIGVPARGFQIIPTDYDIITRGNFAQFLGAAFALPIPLDSARIPFNCSAPSEADKGFATKFGYKIVPLASVRVTDYGYLEAWIGPTLVRKDSELAIQRNNTHLHIEMAQKTPSLQSAASNLLLPEYRVTTAHYMNVTVADKPRVLSKVAEKIRDQGINVFGVLQFRNGQPNQANIAFLLDSCETGRVQNAAKAIATIQGYTRFNVNSLFRVLGNPSR